MSVVKNEIPILEYDSDPAAVIRPGHGLLGITLPKKAVFAFLRDEVDRFGAEHGAETVTFFESATKKYPVYVMDSGGAGICLVQAPVGAPAATQILDWLIAGGVKEIISCGSCGALAPIRENAFLIPVRALCDEGTSYHYLPPARFAETSEKANAAIRKALTKRGVRWEEVTVWSTDGFFRETPEKVRYRLSEGCRAVDMECSALAACSEMRGAVFGQILFTADTLADPARYDERSWGEDSVALALRLAVESVLNI